MDSRLLAVLEQITEEEQRLLDGGRDVEKERYISGQEFIVDREKMLHNGEMIVIRPHTRFVDFPLHRHDFIEMMYVCKGSITHIINGEEIVMEAGDLLVLNQHTRHAIRAAGRDDIAVNFLILPEFFDAAFGLLERDGVLMDFMVSFLRQSDDNGKYLHFKVAGVLPVQNLIENLLTSLAYRQKDEYKINQISIGLLFLYLQKYTRMLDETQPTQYDDIMTMSVLRYIDQHYKTASLTELAKRINQPLSLLSRFIKAKTGATFKQLLQRKRMQVAATLLEDTKLSVSDISLAVGYENNSFFYRCFRDYYKVSPKEYRTENRK